MTCVEGAGGWTGVAGDCHCGKPERGWVAAEGEGETQTPPHRCRQCSIEHCEQAAIARRCEFGVCVREAEVELTWPRPDEDGELAVKVCSIHVSPVLGWGVADPIEYRIRYLLERSDRDVDDRAA